MEVTGINFKFDELTLYKDFRRLKLGAPVQVDKINDNTGINNILFIYNCNNFLTMNSARILFVSPAAAVAACEKMDGFRYRKYILSAKLLVTPVSLIFILPLLPF